MEYVNVFSFGIALGLVAFAALAAGLALWQRRQNYRKIKARLEEAQADHYAKRKQRVECSMGNGLTDIRQDAAQRALPFFVDAQRVATMPETMIRLDRQPQGAALVCVESSWERYETPGGQQYLRLCRFTGDATDQWFELRRTPRQSKNRLSLPISVDCANQIPYTWDMENTLCLSIEQYTSIDRLTPELLKECRGHIADGSRMTDEQTKMALAEALADGYELRDFFDADPGDDDSDAIGSFRRPAGYE